MSKITKTIYLCYWLTLFATFVLILFLSSFFFLGDEMTYTEMKDDFFTNFVGRMIAFFLLSIPSILILLGIDTLLKHRHQGTLKVQRKKFLFLTTVYLGASLIGNVIFFFF